MLRPRHILPLLSALAILPACASTDSVDRNAAAALSRADYSAARVALARSLTSDRTDRNFILDRMRLQIATLADGYPDAAEQITNETFDLLRTQGLNADKTVSSVVLTEGVRTWKGEPFEQAMAYTYVSIQKAMLGQWDNARAAAQSSLFLLKDFGQNEKGERLSTEDIAKRAAQADQKKGAGDEYLDHGYTPIKTDFALGYLLTGIASKALSRPEEASDNFNEVVRLNPGLEPLVASFRNGEYNTVLLVDAGLGPRKVAYGPDNALARFQPQFQSDTRGLRVWLNDDAPAVAPVALDVNQMAASHLWNNLEDVRVAKSTIGEALLFGGVLTAASANQRNSDARANQQIIGLTLAAIGMLMKATSAADTRHLELLPQRVYALPLNITNPDTTISLQIEGEPDTRLVLPAVAPPPKSNRYNLQLLYARVAAGTNAPWAASGQVLYANDAYEGQVPGDDLPFILGGRCVRRPSAAVMDRYHRAGHLTDMQWTDLENLYRDEGIALAQDEHPTEQRRHVLEGGTTLAPPLPGSAGYARLFCQPHPPYRPRTKRCAEIIEQLNIEQLNKESKP